ncbi:nucleotide-diphospho-sugar transferase-domain-containing protein [Syncephalastrum racemosum]|uniref:Nucleotide-diphospho-sugar transferase-domain-containing protein n=1 Tax=Syncephalastrum racemosum TaxID=13706 RepID=A0A1X2H0W5_SYNRA|nr:nucleotide-diphospho-sugar transferase-domain-containing protein [Syncephalastrum racemosum]
MVVVTAAFFASVLAYLTLVDPGQQTWVASKHTVQAGYLQEQQQQAFNATGSQTQAEAQGNASDPWQCTCYSYDDTTQPLPNSQAQNTTAAAAAAAPAAPAVTEQEHGAAYPVIVPEGFAPPPEDLMQKINDNLLDGRVLTVATANFGMRDYLYNWIESLKRTNEDKFLVFCLDDKLYTHLVNAGYEAHAAHIPESWFHQDVPAAFEEYYTPKYRAITHAKTLVVQRLLYLDVTVFFSDVDIVWLRPRMREYVKTFLDIRRETHVIFQQEGLDERQVNTGFFMMRPTYEMKRLLAETIYIQDTTDGMTQQGALNKALDALVLDIRTSSVVLLDVLFFPNGFSYFDNDLPRTRGIDPYILHANYRVGDAKREELRQRGFWYLDDDWLRRVDAQTEQAWEENIDAIMPGNDV